MWPSLSEREQTTEKRSHSNKNRPCELWIHVLQCDRKKGSRRHTPPLPAACEKDMEKWGVGLGWGVRWWRLWRGESGGGGVRGGHDLCTMFTGRDFFVINTPSTCHLPACHCAGHQRRNDFTFFLCCFMSTETIRTVQ